MNGQLMLGHLQSGPGRKPEWAGLVTPEAQFSYMGRKLLGEAQRHCQNMGNLGTHIVVKTGGPGWFKTAWNSLARLLNGSVQL